MWKLNFMYYMKSIFNNYVVGVFIISGIILTLFHGRTNTQNKFPKEAKIAKFGGILYIAAGLGIFFLSLFL